MTPTSAKLKEYALKLGKTHKLTVIGHQTSATDKPLDKLVYELYGLTDKEAAIVEEAAH